MDHVRGKYEEMKAKLDGLWDKLYSDWAARVPGEVNTNLAKTLLSRHEDNSISTNFAPEVSGTAVPFLSCKPCKVSDARSICPRQLVWTSAANESLIGLGM